MLLIDELKSLGFEIGTLNNITGCELNKQKLIYIKIPLHNEAFIYSYIHELDNETVPFFFGDSVDAEFFTISVISIEQIKDLLISLNPINYAD
jgi:hypothetical protein